MKSRDDAWMRAGQEPDEVASGEPLLEPLELLDPPVTAGVELELLLSPDGVLVAEDDGVLVLVLVLDFVVDASAADVLLSCHTTTPVAAATATPAADTAAVTARALRRPRSRTFIAPPLDR